MPPAPLVRGRKGEHKEVFAQIRKAGFLRCVVNGEVFELVPHVPELAPRKNHEIDAVVDRIVVRPGVETRIGDSLRLAIRHGNGLLIAYYQKPTDPAATKTNGNGGGNGRTKNGDRMAVQSVAAENGAAYSDWQDELFSTQYACPTLPNQLRRVGAAHVQLQ